MIEIQDLTGKLKDDIVDILLVQKKQPFQIYIPKDTVLFRSENNAIAMDYLKLAYSGELINSVCESMDYDYVGPGEHESVLFKVNSSRIEELAEVLFNISFGYVNDVDDDIYKELDDAFEFEMYMDQYESDVSKGKIKPVCPDFMELFNEYQEESD